MFSIWLSIVRNVTPSLYSVSYNLHAPIWVALRKRGYFKFASEREGIQKGGMFPQKKGVPTLEETMIIIFFN